MAGERVLLYLARDLYFGVRIADTATRHGWRCIALAPTEDAAAAIARHRPAVVLADLQAPAQQWTSLLQAARQAPGGPVPAIAFGSHMDLAARAAALQAGATAVVANSKMAADLAGVLDHYAPAQSTTG